MKVLKTVAMIAGCAGFGLIGCSGKQEQAPAPTEETAKADDTAAAPDAAAPAADAADEGAGEPGNIKVTVAFEGDAPKQEPLNRKADPYCAKTQKLDESVIVKDGKVQNVVVQIASKVKSDATAPAEPVKIDQNECTYSPRVSTAMVGQQIEISNSDKTLHNVHAYKGENKDNWFNSAQPPKAPAISKDLEEGLVQLKCDVHPWMTSYVAVASHPFIGVSGEDGVVTLTNVPSKGKPYKVSTWHEVWGKQEVEVTVEPGKTAEVTVTYKADKAAN